MVGLRPWLRVPILGFGLGAVAGGLEVVALGATSDLPMTIGAAAGLAGAAVALGGLLGAVFGLLAGMLVEVGTRSWFPPKRYAAGMAAVGTLLACWYLWPLGYDKFEQGLVPAAIAFALTPIGASGVVWFNALYWFRREELGEDRKVGWSVVSLLAGLALAGVGALSMAQRDYGSARALADDPTVLLVGIEGLRADHVSHLDPNSPVRTPALDALAESGLVYANAVSPVPAAGPAWAALQTGRHPVRADVVFPGDRLLRGHQTVAEVFDREGYATGAFVGSAALAGGRGLEQGFEAWDDDLPLPVRGLARVQLVRLGFAAVRALAPAALADLDRRDDAVTIDRAVAWLAAVGKRPALLWVHLGAPAAAPDAPGYRSAVQAADASLARLVAAVRAASGERPVTVVVVGLSGRSLGEHARPFGALSVYDEAVRVPLVVAPHELRGIKTRRIPHQVRLMDVPATLLGVVHLDPMEHSEGGDLVGFAQGVRTRHYASLLVAPRGPSDVELGYRAARGTGEGGEDGNIKFRLDAATGGGQLFDLVDDPGETNDLSQAQPDAVAAVRARVLQEAGALAPAR